MNSDLSEQVLDRMEEDIEYVKQMLDLLILVRTERAETSS